MRVLDQESVKARVTIKASLVNRDRRDLADIQFVCRRAGQSLQVHDPDQCALHAEQCFYDANLVHRFALVSLRDAPELNAADVYRLDFTSYRIQLERYQSFAQPAPLPDGPESVVMPVFEIGAASVAFADA